VARSLLKKRVRKQAQSHDRSARLDTVLDPTGVASQAYRTLRTSLLCIPLDTPPKVIVVTSPGPMEGKSRAAKLKGCEWFPQDVLLPREWHKGQISREAIHNRFRLPVMLT